MHEFEFRIQENIRNLSERSWYQSVFSPVSLALSHFQFYFELLNSGIWSEVWAENKAQIECIC